MMNLVFIYNANSGFANGLIDSLHKALSPKTYSCDLCSLTHAAFGMKKEWNEFLKNLPVDKVFLHKDEIEKKFPAHASFELPCVCLDKEGVLQIIVSANELKNMTSPQIQKRIEEYITG